MHTLLLFTPLIMVTIYMIFAVAIIVDATFFDKEEPKHKPRPHKVKRSHSH